MAYSWMERTAFSGQLFMREKILQHYVPQFYLRLFATKGSEQHVRMYNLERGLYIECAPIRNQAAENHFYKSRQIEDALGDFEAKAASIIRQIINDLALPKFQTDGFKDLLLFLLLQHARTRHAVEAFDETWKKMKQVALAGDPRRTLPLELQTEVDNVPRFLMETTVMTAHAAMDLRAKLIINKTSDPFITSDNPVVLYNKLLMDKHVPGGRTGIGCKGLQLFLPLNPDLLLLLFDAVTYKVGGRKLSSERVELKSTKDVLQLNRLQAVNALSNLYFGDSAKKHFITTLVEKSRKYRRREKVSVQEYRPVEPSWTTQGSLVVQHRVEISAPLELSFVRVTPSGEKYDPRGKSVHMRNEQLLWSLEDKMIAELRERLVGREIAGLYARE